MRSLFVPLCLRCLALFTRPLMVFLRLILRQSSFHINRSAPIGFCTPLVFQTAHRLRRSFVLYLTCRVCRSCFGSHFSSLFSGIGSWRCHTPVFVKIQDLSTRATPARFSTGTNPGGSTGSVVSGDETRMHASDLR